MDFPTFKATTMKNNREAKLHALAIALALRCEPCVSIWKKELGELSPCETEAIHAALTIMQGGPGFVYVNKYLPIPELTAANDN